MKFSKLLLVSALSFNFVFSAMAGVEINMKARSKEQKLKDKINPSTAGMDLCLRSEKALVHVGYSIKLKKIPNNLIEVIAVNHGKEKMLGRLERNKISKLNPLLRKATSGVEAVALPVATVLGSIGAGSLAAAAGIGSFGVSTAASATAIAGTAVGGGAVLATQASDVFNPIAQWERGNVEKCLQTVNSLSEKSHEITLSKTDDYNDTVKAMKDLIHDLNKSAPLKVARVNNSDRTIAVYKSFEQAKKGKVSGTLKQ